MNFGRTGFNPLNPPFSGLNLRHFNPIYLPVNEDWTLWKETAKSPSALIITLSARFPCHLVPPILSVFPSVDSKIKIDWHSSSENQRTLSRSQMKIPYLITQTDSPQPTMVQLVIFWLRDVAKVIHIQEKMYFTFWILIFFWTDTQYHTLFWCWAEVVICGHAVVRANSWYSHNHSVLVQPFCFSHLVQYWINYMSYSTSCWKMISFIENRLCVRWCSQTVTR